MKVLLTMERRGYNDYDEWGIRRGRKVRKGKVRRLEIRRGDYRRGRKGIRDDKKRLLER